MKKLHALTGNDIALAEEGLSHAINFWKKSKHPRTKFVKGRIATYSALLEKLDAIASAAYPYARSDNMPLDIGDEKLYVPNRDVIAACRRRAKRVSA